ncbi:PQQ-dependent dehydrogenase, methanol/ethanol family [Hyphomicrobium sp.]|uniref:PQQ-dependent dehydrogenase, methanol/ethanol family n=1 Tax=Hyphomicrobium sp. TaxID=82 RepID=UPI0025BB7A52|nr:PQQ-dependent dehydrogenase, methanol/ethanol family [Hyphomicrobium sp.]MCC7253968.1 PQQ-dependent dehydrogenase, methanol/ethanol family [Hyphomicrobium sp.]
MKSYRLAASLVALSMSCVSPAFAQEKSVSAERLLNADKEPENWITHHKNYQAHRFSPLNQITADNVKGLKVAWTLALGGIEGGGMWTHGGLTGTPLVEDGFLYFADGWGSVYKIDAHGAKPKLVWKMDPKTDRDWAGAVTCCGVNNRGVALWQDLVISHVIDGRLIATTKKDGEVAWIATLADPEKAETITAAPLIIKDMAITGVAGAEFGIRGWIAATDLKTGKELWRTYTVPAKGEPGSETWKDDYNAAATGGGSSWVTGTYDASTDTIYWGTGNPGPDWDHEYRPGDNLFTNSTLALDADTGKVKWYFQHTPNDPFDYDSVAERVLVDLPDGGKKILLQADRNGFAYALDRESGDFLWASPFVNRVSWTKGIDPKTGKPQEYDPKKDIQPYLGAPNRTNLVGTACPGNMGGKNWPPTSYNPDLKLLYIPTIESCNQLTVTPTKPGSYKAKEFFTGGGPKQHERITGSVVALDVTSGKIAKKIEVPFPMLGGMLSTPDLVFTGHPDGKVSAYDAKTLEELWTFETGSGVNAPPITFSVDGKQYIAIAVGLGGAWPKWFVDSTPELKDIQPSSMLYAFALGD